MTFQSLSELGLKLNTARDISNLIGAAYDLDGVLIQEADLAPDFFDLKTGLLKDLNLDFEHILHDIQEIYNLSDQPGWHPTGAAPAAR